MTIIINPVPLPPFGGQTYNQITPFTYRDGLTYIEVLESLRTYIRDVLVPLVNEGFEDAEDYVNNAVAELTQFVTTAIADNVTWTEEQVSTLTTYVNDTVQQIIGSSVEVQDPVVAGIFGNAGSETRIVTDQMYADKVAQEIIETGRLSDETLTAKFSRGVSVAEFGAVGDGVTDDTQAFADAMQYLIDNFSGGALHVPAGVHMVTTVRQMGNTKIEGTGNDSVIQSIDGVLPIITNWSTNSTSLGVSDVKLIGVRDSGSPTGDGIYWDYPAGSPRTARNRIRDVRVEYVSGAALRGSGKHAGGATVTNFRSYMCGAGVFWSAHDTVFMGCDVGQNGAYGYQISGGNNKLIGCNAWFSGRDSFTSGIGFYLSSPTTGGGQNQLTGCQAQDSGSYSLWIAGQNRSQIDGFYADGSSADGENTSSGLDSECVRIQNADSTVINGLYAVNRFVTLTSPAALRIESTATNTIVSGRCENMITAGARGSGLGINGNVVNLTSSNPNHVRREDIKGYHQVVDTARTDVAESGSGTVTLKTGIKALDVRSEGYLLDVTFSARQTNLAANRFVGKATLSVYRNSGGANVLLSSIENVFGALWDDVLTAVATVNPEGTEVTFEFSSTHSQDVAIYTTLL